MIKKFLTRPRMIGAAVFTGFFAVNILPLYVFDLKSDPVAVALNVVAAFLLSCYCAMKIK